MKQSSFSELEYAGKKKRTRREIFLDEMNRLIPWKRLLSVLEPHYFPNAHKGGRPPIGLEKMLRMYFVQQFYNLADKALEDTVYDSQALRTFIGIDLTREHVPDATTLLKFRHWLEANDYTQAIFASINASMEEKGLLMRQGTIVDATIIHAPSSTKNKEKKRDPEMRSTKKGNNYYFGIKAHIGVDAVTGMVHSVSTTAANVHDIVEADKLLHGEEETVWGDSGYIGIEKRPEHSERKVEWQINQRRSSKPKGIFAGLPELYREYERAKSQVRAKVEHPFHIIKTALATGKTRYRGIKKNTAQFYIVVPEQPTPQQRL